MLKRVWAQKSGMFGIILASVVLLSALFAPWVAPHDPYAMNMDEALEPPSLTHPMGTDVLGRDVMSRLIFGARISMEVSVLSRLISLLLGTLLGLVAGYFGGKLDSLIMRIADVTLAYPALLLLIAVVAAVGPSRTSLIISLGVVGWAAVARVVRAQVLSIKEREFVMAVRSLGGRHGASQLHVTADYRFFHGPGDGNHGRVIDELSGARRAASAAELGIDDQFGAGLSPCGTVA